MNFEVTRGQALNMGVAMRVRDIAKTIGHVILSLVLTVLIPAVSVAPLILFNPSPDPSSLGFKAASTVPFYILAGALIAQWHRRVSIRRRLLSFVIVCVAGIIFALPVALLQLPSGSEYGLQTLLMGVFMLVLAGQLAILGTINSPWPIPIARLWRGEIGLARTYWVWLGLIFGSLVTIFSAILLALYDLTGSSFIIALKVALGLIFTFFYVVSIWRSARNYQGPRRWRVVARVACILFGIFAVVNLAGLLWEVPVFKALAGDPRKLETLMQPHSANRVQ